MIEYIKKLSAGKVEEAEFIAKKRFGIEKRRVFMEGFRFARNKLKKQKGQIMAEITKKFSYPLQ